MDFCRICAVDIPEDTQQFEIENLEKEFAFINTENIDKLIICNDCLLLIQSTQVLIKKAKDREHLVQKKIQDAVSKCATCQKFQCTCDETIVVQNEAIGNQSLATDDKTSDVSKQFRCDACACSFQTYDMLKGHNQVKHNQIKHKFSILKCPKCDRTFRRKHNLKEHLQKHYKSKKFICDICKRKFQFKTSLRSHMHIHSLRFICQKCKKPFTRKQILKKHLSRATCSDPRKKEQNETNKPTKEEQVKRLVNQIKRKWTETDMIPGESASKSSSKTSSTNLTKKSESKNDERERKRNRSDDSGSSSAK